MPISFRWSFFSAQFIAEKRVCWLPNYSRAVVNCRLNIAGRPMWSMLRSTSSCNMLGRGQPIMFAGHHMLAMIKLLYYTWPRACGASWYTEVHLRERAHQWYRLSCRWGSTRETSLEWETSVEWGSFSLPTLQLIWTRFNKVFRHGVSLQFVCKLCADHLGCVFIVQCLDCTGANCAVCSVQIV